jgi:hypothetical protein
VLALLQAKQDWVAALEHGRHDSEFVSQMKDLMTNLPKEEQASPETPKEAATRSQSAPARTAGGEGRPKEGAAEAEPQQGAVQQQAAPVPVPVPIGRFRRLLGISIGILQGLAGSLPEIARSRTFLWLLAAIVGVCVFGPSSWVKEALGLGGDGGEEEKAQEL